MQHDVYESQKVVNENKSNFVFTYNFLAQKRGPYVSKTVV